MKINKKIAAGVAGITMAGTAFAAGPAFAQTDDGTDVADDGTEADATRPPFGDGLQDLVDNGTISQEQLDSLVEPFEARPADGARGVDHLAVGAPALQPRRDGVDLPVLEDHVELAVDAPRRVDHAAAGDQDLVFAHGNLLC